MKHNFEDEEEEKEVQKLNTKTTICQTVCCININRAKKSKNKTKNYNLSNCLLHKYKQNNHTKLAHGIIASFFTFLGQLASSLVSALNVCVCGGGWGSMRVTCVRKPSKELREW